MTKPECIFLCHTPLHVLIAKKVIELKALSDYSFIYMIENRSEKNLYYFSLLQANATRSAYIIKKNNYLDFVLMPFSLIKFFKRFSRKTIYSGNIKTFYSRYIFWVLNCKTIYSFDDGIGNIRFDAHPGQGYFERESEIPVAKLFFSIFDKSLLYKNLIKSVAEHYTIYEYPNVYANAKFISLFPQHFKKKVEGAKLNILISSALALENYMSKQEEIAFYNKLIKMFSIDLVIQHPRNNDFVPEAPCEVSESLLIAEHQILSLAEKYTLFVVSPFYSSVLINIPSAIDKLNVITMNPKKDHPEVRSFHDYIGIETREIEL